MNEFVIELQNVAKAYGSQLVLRDINLQVSRGEFLTLLGPSGCGKTTLLRLLAGFEQATRGVILIDGQEISHLAPERRRVNTVFQSYPCFPI